MGIVIKFPAGRAVRDCRSVEHAPEAGHANPDASASGMDDADSRLLELSICLKINPVAIKHSIDCILDEDKLIVWKNWRFRGVWAVADGRYEWIPAGYLLPTFRCQLAPQAVKATLARIQGWNAYGDAQEHQ